MPAITVDSLMSKFGITRPYASRMYDRIKYAEYARDRKSVRKALEVSNIILNGRSVSTLHNDSGFVTRPGWSTIVAAFVLLDELSYETIIYDVNYEKFVVTSIERAMKVLPPDRRNVTVLVKGKL